MFTERSRGGRVARACVPVLLLPLLMGGGFELEPQPPLLIRADELHTGSGTVIPGGMLLIVDGRIVAVGTDIAVPPDATVIEVAGGSLTPGLIDANAAVEASDVVVPRSRTASQVLHDAFCPTHPTRRAGSCCGSTCPRALQHASGEPCRMCGFPTTRPATASVGTRRWATTAEHSAEVVPHTRVIDAVNLRSPDFDRLLAGGVTTIFVSADSASVIGSQGAIIRTGGPIARRIIRDTDAVKAVMGSDPYARGTRNSGPWRRNVDFHSRRPTTRMGVTWVFRKALYDARRHEQGLEIHGADTPPAEAMDTLSRILAGEIPLRIQARMQHDILSAIRLADEFDLSFVLEEATEAYLCLGELKAANAPVIFGPIYVTPTGYRRRSTETDRSRLHTMKALLDAGIETALTAHELREEDGLARQAMYAIRYGVGLASVTRSVTQTPAKLLGLEREIGTLEAGKQADIVVWSGKPFEATSKPVVVLINGQVVFDRRSG